MMNDKVVIVTGATNGIGEVTAHELARMGAQVVVVGRNKDRCQATIERIRQNAVKIPDYIVADLSTLSGVNDAADTVLERYQRLDVLVNNAGAIFDKRQLSADGYEMTFALNHLSYFVLTRRLLDLLLATANQHGEARIVNVSSGAHFSVSGVRFDDIQREKKYSPFGVYAETKLMNILFTYELARRTANTGVIVNALHPGFVATGFGHNMSGIAATLLKWVQRFFALSPEKGAETNIYLASSPDIVGITGKYWDKCKPVSSSKASYDTSAQSRLWELSEKLANIANETSPIL